MGPAADTRAIARRYFDAWTSKDTATAGSLLADDFTFVAGDMRIQGRATFLDAGAFPADATTAMVAEAYEGTVGFQSYEASRAGVTIRIIEQLTVQDGLIQRSEFTTDMAAYQAFLAA